MEGSSIKTFENLCKIFETRIKLDNIKGEKTTKEVAENYEKYAKKIDNFYNDEFQKELKKLISPKETLEKERERLEKLISLLENRLQKRSELVKEYHSTTGKYIKDLQLIVSESELNNKKERLELITRYLDTTTEINDINEAITKLQGELTDEEKSKEEYFNKNKDLEDELYSVFVTCISDDEYYKEIEEDKINDILVEVSQKTKENKETLDITKESIKSLVSSGMDDEYESYVEEANKNYSLWKDREIILSIYRLVIDFEDEFDNLVKKRTSIDELLEERKNILLEKENILVPFENVVLEQNKTLGFEKGILDNIVNYTNRIGFKEERLKELEEIVKEPEILVILKEYDLYDDGTKNDDDIELDILPAEELPNLVIKEYNPYKIVNIMDAPVTLNINLAKLKGASVREKVNKKLNPELVTPSLDEITNIPILEEQVEETPETDIETPVVEEQENSDVEPSEDINLESDKEETEKEEEDTTTTEDTTTEEKSDDSTVAESSEPSESNPEEQLNVDNSFWIPVSESKLEPSEFPNINIPISNDNLVNDEDNFGFPEVDN